MQFIERDIKIHLDIDEERFSAEANSIVGGAPLEFSIVVSPLQTNTYLKVSLLEQGVAHYPRIAPREIDRRRGVATYRISTHTLATGGPLTLKIDCVVGRQQLRKSLAFTLVGLLPGQLPRDEPFGRPESSGAAAGESDTPADAQSPSQETADSASDATETDEPASDSDIRCCPPDPAPEPDDAVQASEQLVGSVMSGASKETPIFLVPCRIETRLTPKLLKIRIYPDQIAIDSLQRKLTKNEMKAGKTYWDGVDQLAEWRQLLKSYSPGRAAWIVKEAKGHNVEIGSPSDVCEYRDPEELQFPKLKLLPKFFLVSLYLNCEDDLENREVIRVVGNEIAADGLDIMSLPQTEADGLVGHEAAWVADYKKAVEKGMAVAVDRSLLGDAQCIEKITVVGIRPMGHGAKTGKEMLNEILESHHYSEGVGFLRHGTPTNNTEVAVPGYSRAEVAEERFERECGTNKALSQSAANLSKMLCLDESLLEKWENSSILADSMVEDFHEAIWSSTGEYYLKQFFAGLIGETGRQYLKDLFVKYVRPMGFLPALRIGKIPYGILPVTRFRQDPDSDVNGWQASVQDSAGASADVPRDPQFDNAFQGILERLAEMWLAEALSDQVPNAAGGSGEYTMDEQLARILAMSPDSQSYVLRSFNHHVLTDILLSLSLGDGSRSLFFRDRTEYVERTEKAINELLQRDTQFTPALAFIETFGNYRSTPYPLVRDPDYPADGPEAYFPRLPDPAAKEDEFNTLLYRLLFRSNLLRDEAGSEIPALYEEEFVRKIANLEIEDLEFEAFLKSVLDLFSFRLDPWISSLANRRLASMRHQSGCEFDEVGDVILIGAYGYVEKLDLVEVVTQQGGFTHAPSLDQATTAAILKNAFITDSEYEPDPGAMDITNNEYERNPAAMNISSDRIRRALDVLHGIGNEQELGERLGYQFERMLREGNQAAHIDEFRAAFPFDNRPNNGESTDPAVPEDKQARPRNVVNGLKLIADKVVFPPQLAATIAADDTGTLQDAIFHLRDTMDAISDLMLHESVYQAVRGNYERAGAALDIASGKSFPVEPESVSVALPSNTFGNRICLTFDTDLSAATPSDSPRANAEPKIAHWFATLLSDMSKGEIRKIGCNTSYEALESNGDIGERQKAVSLPDLGLEPIDFLYLCAIRPGGGATELESRIREFVRAESDGIILESRNKERISALSDGAIIVDKQRIEIDFGAYSFTPPEDAVPLEDAVELANLVLNFLNQAKYLRPDQLFKETAPPDGEDMPDPPAFSPDDFDEIAGRVEKSKDCFEALVDDMAVMIAPLRVGLKYLRLLDGVLNELKKSMPTNGGQPPLPDDVLQGLRDYLGSNSDNSTITLDAAFETESTDIINKVNRPDDEDPVAAIFALLEDILSDAFDSDPDIAGLTSDPAIASLDIRQKIEVISNLKLAEVIPCLEKLRLHGISIDFHPELTPDIAIAIFDTANERCQAADSSWKVLKANSSDDYEALIELAIATAKIIFGDSFIILPQFSVPDRDNVSAAMSSQESILKDHSPNRIYQWMQGVAQTHSAVQRLEDFLMFTDAWTSPGDSSRFRPCVLPLPLQTGEPFEAWQALDNADLGYRINEDRPEGILDVVVFSNAGAEPLAEKTCGLHIDQWEEKLPHDKVDTAITFQADTPNQQPINCCLVAVPSRRDGGSGSGGLLGPQFGSSGFGGRLGQQFGDFSDSGSWDLLDLDAIVCDTIDLAKIRAVDLDAMPDVAGLFPTIFLPRQNGQDRYLADLSPLQFA